MLEQSVSRVSYFETSANRILTPVEALEEAQEALKAFDSEPEQTWMAVPFALKRLSIAVASSVLNRELLNLPSVAQLKTDIDDFFLQQSALSGRERKSFVSNNASEIGNQITRLSEELHTVYREKLIERTVSAISPERSLSSNREKVFKIAPELATFFIHQGRDIDYLAIEIGTFIKNAQNTQGTDLTDAVKKLLSANRISFAVATVITGAVNAKIPADLEGKEIRFPGPAMWGTGKQPRMQKNGRKTRRREFKTSKNKNKYINADLTKFCMDHWKVDVNEPNYDHKVHAQVIVWDIDAWDYAQARQIALDNSENLMDRINAEHRIGEFGVKRKVLIWKRGEPNTRYISDEYQGTMHTRVMKKHSSPSVQRSLRFASRSSTERAGAMAVFFGWAALEYLGRGNDVRTGPLGHERPLTPQNFIATFLPKVVALAALQHLANDVSHAISNEIQIQELPTEVRNALRLKNKKAPQDHVDQRHLFYLLAASSSNQISVRELAEQLQTSPEKARAALTQFSELIKVDNPIDRYRIRVVSRLLQNAESMAQYLSAVERDADVALQRMRYVRNQTAHSTIPESLRYRTLSNALREILDTCYQAIDNNHTIQAPHETIHRLAEKYDSLISDLRANEMEQVFSPHKALLLRP